MITTAIAAVAATTVTACGFYAAYKAGKEDGFKQGKKEGYSEGWLECSKCQIDCGIKRTSRLNELPATGKHEDLLSLLFPLAMLDSFISNRPANKEQKPNPEPKND